jgi:hypothetical protein
MALSGRPLTVSEADQAHYLRRPVDDRLDRALDAGFNVLLGARRGAGATTMLNRLEGESPDPVLINAAEATEPWHVIQAIATRAAVPRHVLSELAAPFQRIDPLAVPRVLRDIRHALQEEGRQLTVLLDGPIDAPVANMLFGRLRDALFALPMTWVVVAHDEKLAEYLTPPADVFFETVERIEDLDDTGVETLLTLRNAGDLVERDIKDAHDGTPRHALALARARLMRARDDDEETMRRYADATSGLSRSASMLLAELQGRGPVAATDADLLLRLGVSDRHLRRSFAELADVGLVEKIPGGRGGPGRPATTYALTPLGAYTQGTVIAHYRWDAGE